MKWIRQNFSAKLAVTFFLVMGPTLAFIGIFTVRSLKSHLIEELKQILSAQARQLRVAITPNAFVQPHLSWESYVKKIKNETGTRITFIRKDGRVVADSEVEWPDLNKVENHASRPEILEARKTGLGSNVRRSQTVGIEFLYVAVPYPSQDNLAGFVRIAVPLTRVTRKIKSFTNIILTGIAGAVGVGFVLILIFSGWVTQPLKRITQTAGLISEGRLDERVPVDSEDELGQLSRTFNSMTQKVIDTVEEVQTEKDRINSILSGMMEQVLAIDFSGNIVFLNRAAEKLFGVTNPEATGQPFVKLIRQAGLVEIANSVLKDRREIVKEIALFLGTERLFEIRATPFKTQEPDGGALLVLHDITRISNLEKIRKDFVANVSHELKTPLTSIQGFAETLLEGALSDRQHNREFVQSIHSESERLSRLVDDLLSLSWIESGRKRPALVPVSLSEIIKEIQQSLKPQSDKHKIQWHITLPSELPQVQADRDLLKQALLNVLDNAIKFNKEGGTVEVSAKPEYDSVAISITDSGIGIPAEDLPRIFERFYRVDKGRSREMGGTGLGLAIVKHIVEAHHGKVEMQSTPEKGSTITIRLPA